MCQDCIKQRLLCTWQLVIIICEWMEEKNNHLSSGVRGKGDSVKIGLARGFFSWPVCHATFLFPSLASLPSPHFSSPEVSICTPPHPPPPPQHISASSPMLYSPVFLHCIQTDYPIVGFLHEMASLSTLSFRFTFINMSEGKRNMTVPVSPNALKKEKRKRSYKVKCL